MEIDCLFCSIVNGGIDAYRVFENEHTLVILDINPINPGHLLVIPKKHFSRLKDMDEMYGVEVFRTVMKMENLVSACGCSGTNILQNNGKVAGQEIGHVHFHIIPRFTDDGFRFKRRKVPVTPAMLDFALDYYRKKLESSI